VHKHTHTRTHTCTRTRACMIVCVRVGESTQRACTLCVCVFPCSSRHPFNTSFCTPSSR
jgi:hypothetical protein